ncbi:MAG: type III-B CRISPR-associated protein Cas10/Cmr2 [Gammaproteobacteria bacterium]|nr:type III-B CRISPR-associated protein Cas10/Cmr2 [Gammaproteobacteria bacterium]
MNKENTTILHFSLGPVQGFIGQARRTRDLWAGSFLLSWLSAQAMAALVTEYQGVMIFPKIKDDPMYKAICGEGKEPYIATLPNRFQATVSADFDANLLTQKINQKWQALADAVYARFIENKAIAGVTRAIWDRQVDDFWEVQWVLGAENNLLDKRKNWRSQYLTVEGGEHCTTMGDYQELSGQKKGQQDDFWQSIRERSSHNETGVGEGADYLNLRPNERLCAIAFVKRFFVHLTEEELKATIGWVPNGDAKKLANFPSTTYMAAAPWLENIKINEQVLTAYYQHIEEKIVDNGSFRRISSEQPTQLNCIATTNNWNNLDGNLFNQTALMNWRSTKLSDSSDYYDKNKNDPDADIRNSILEKLKALPKQSSNFYALLLMDGDSLGKLLSNSEQAQIVSRCLAYFSQGVDAVVKKSCGVTIYAGGDDVLALVPIHQVIGCAQQLCRHYQKSFENTGILDPSISAAIIFSHFHNPFTEVIDQAHHQLEKIAKEQNGRNSIAMAIMKPGNLSAQWVNEWDDDLLQTFTTIANALRIDELPHGFFYKISERYSHILKQNDKEFFKAIVKAELIKSKGKQAEVKLVDIIYQLCQHNNIKQTAQLSALYFARFLATEDKSKDTL